MGMLMAPLQNRCSTVGLVSFTSKGRALKPNSSWSQKGYAGQASQKLKATPALILAITDFRGNRPGLAGLWT